MPDNVLVGLILVGTNQVPEGGPHYQEVKLLSGGKGETEGIKGTLAFGLYADIRRSVTIPTRVAKGVSSAVSSSTPAEAAAGVSIALNAARINLFIENDLAVPIVIKYGIGAAENSRTLKLKAGGYWEMPQPVEPGIVSFISIGLSATGQVNITEQNG